MMALDAIYVLQSADGSRTVAARDFYQGVYETALAENELLVEIRIPAPAAGTGMSYQKIKRKVGDYAIAIAAAAAAHPVACLANAE
jgi:carbon-monoxide dehydrogenase medium subunit